MAKFKFDISKKQLDTKIDAKAGDVYVVKVDGLLAISGSHGPGGLDEFAPPSWPEPGLRKYALYASYGSIRVPIPANQISDDHELTFTALQAGRLRFAINDDDATSHSGTFSIDVTKIVSQGGFVRPFTFHLPAKFGYAGPGRSNQRTFRSPTADDIIVLEACGMMNNGSAFSSDNGPSGFNNVATPADFPAPDLPPYCLYAEIGSGTNVRRRLAFQGQKDSPYGTIRTKIAKGDGWLRIRLNDSSYSNNTGGFRVYLWKNADGEILSKHGVHLSSPTPVNGWIDELTDHSESGRAFPRGLHSIAPTAIEQKAANCFLMASLASLARSSPKFVREMIDDHQDGTYTVRMYDGLHGRQVSLLLDSFFPAYIGGWQFGSKPEGIRLDGSLEVLWPALLAKAYYMMRGHSYGDVEKGGISWEPWDRMVSISTDWSIFFDMDARKFLEKGIGKGRPMTASTWELWTWAVGKRERIWNVPRQHVYSVLDYQKTGGANGDWDVYLFNPHHQTEYKKGQGKTETSDDGDGFFWMPLSKMKDVFGQLCYVAVPGGTPKAEMYLLDKNGKFKSAWKESWRYPWNVIVPVQFGNKSGVLSHRYQDYETCLEEVDPSTGKLKTVWRTKWGHRWNIMVPVQYGTKYGLLEYSLEDEIVVLDEFQSDGSLKEVWRKKLTKPIDVAVPIRFGLTNGILTHNFKDGEFAIQTLSASGKLYPNMSWQSSRTDVMAAVDFGNEFGIFSHRFKDRSVLFGHVKQDRNPSGSGPRNVLFVQNEWATNWSDHWDMVYPVYWGPGNTGLLEYDSDTGVACISRFNRSHQLSEYHREKLNPKPNVVATIPMADKTWVLTHTW